MRFVHRFSFALQDDRGGIKACLRQAGRCYIRQNRQCHSDAAILGIMARSRPMNWCFTLAPVSKTSSAESVLPVMPAAMLVTQEMPRTRMPEWRASRNFGTVGIAPKGGAGGLEMLISCGGSVVGASRAKQTTLCTVTPSLFFSCT